MYLIEQLNEYSTQNPEFKPLFYDLLRTIIVQVVVQLLFSFNNPSVAFLNTTFIQTSIYLCVGVAVFWMIAYKFLLSQNLFKLDI
jgi:hypothetical protein